MGPRDGSKAFRSWGYTRAEWKTYFEAVAQLPKPHTARRRAGDMARSCPYPDVAAAGIATVKAAIAARKAAAALDDPAQRP